MHVLNFLKTLGADLFCIHFQFSKKKNEMNFIHQKSFMPKYEISIGSYFFSPARLYTQQQPQPGSHLNSSTGGPCNSGIDFKYRIPAANSIYIHTHTCSPPRSMYSLLQRRRRLLQALLLLLLVADLQMVNNQNSKINIKRAPLYACSYCTYLVM